MKRSDVTQFAQLGTLVADLVVITFKQGTLAVLLQDILEISLPFYFLGFTIILR